MNPLVGKLQNQLNSIENQDATKNDQIHHQKLLEDHFLPHGEPIP